MSGPLPLGRIFSLLPLFMRPEDSGAHEASLNKREHTGLDEEYSWLLLLFGVDSLVKLTLEREDGEVEREGKTSDPDGRERRGTANGEHGEGTRPSWWRQAV